MNIYKISPWILSMLLLIPLITAGNLLIQSNGLELHDVEVLINGQHDQYIEDYDDIRDVFARDKIDLRIVVMNRFDSDVENIRLDLFCDDSIVKVKRGKAKIPKLGAWEEREVTLKMKVDKRATDERIDCEINLFEDYNTLVEILNFEIIVGH